MKSQSPDHDFLKPAELLKNIPQSVYWKDLNSTYWGCSQYMAEQVGLNSEQEIIGKTDYDLSWHASAPTIIANDRLVIEQGREYIFEEHGVNKAGTLILARSVKSPLRNAAGDVVGILGISIDLADIVEDREKMIQRLTHQANSNQLESDFLRKLYHDISGQTIHTDISHADLGVKIRTYLEDIICKLPAHVFWRSIDGRYLGCNDKTAQFLGFNSREDIIGKRNEEFLSPEVASALIDKDKYILSQGLPAVFEESAISQNGKPVTFLTHKAPIKDETGKVVGLLGVSLDISERKQMERDLKIAREEAEAANLSKTHFLNNMRHDIRTPLSCVVGSARILKQMETDPDKLEFLAGILTSSESLLQMLTNMLEYDSVQSTERPVTYTAIQIRKLIKDLVDMLGFSAKQKGLQLQYEIADNVPQVLNIDQYRVQRILLNLLNNSIKFTKEGYVSIRLDTQIQSDQNIALKIEVDDSGIGIAQKDHERVFDQFVRLHPTSHSESMEEGLGLSIVKQYINELNGTIELDSEPGRGTTFKLLLPAPSAKQQSLDASTQGVRHASTFS